MADVGSGTARPSAAATSARMSARRRSAISATTLRRVAVVRRVATVMRAPRLPLPHDARRAGPRGAPSARPASIVVQRRARSGPRSCLDVTRDEQRGGRGCSSRTTSRTRARSSRRRHSNSSEPRVLIWVSRRRASRSRARARSRVPPRRIAWRSHSRPSATDMQDGAAVERELGQDGVPVDDEPRSGRVPGSRWTTSAIGAGIVEHSPTPKQLSPRAWAGWANVA